MAHYRQTIRKTVAEKTLRGITFEGNAVSVYPNRLDPFWREEIPAIGAYFFEEPAEHKDTAPREYYREMRLAIEIMLGRLSAEIDDMADDIAEQVEAKMFKDPYLEDTVEDSSLESSTMRFATQGDVIYASLVIVFIIEYRTWSPKQQTVDDFLTQETKIDADNNPEASIDAESTVRVP